MSFSMPLEQDLVIGRKNSPKFANNSANQAWAKDIFRLFRKNQSFVSEICWNFQWISLELR